MVQDYSQAFFMALAFAAAGLGIAKLVAFMGERRLENRHGGNFRQLFAWRAKLESRLEARRTDRAAELQGLNKEIADLGRRRQGLERQIKDSQLAADVPIRLIGEEVTGLACYIALVANKYAGGAGTQKAHALLDPSWAQPQIIHVWARGMGEARGEIERRYPPAFGFVVTRLQDVAQPAIAKPAVAKAG